MREILGGVPLNSPEVLSWVNEFIGDGKPEQDRK
jgi:hypothetical protein